MRNLYSNLLNHKQLQKVKIPYYLRKEPTLAREEGRGGGGDGVGGRVPVIIML